MNILDTLVRLKEDLKSWVTINLNALDAKIEANTVPIDSELNSTSTNPVQNKVINENLQNLKELVNESAISIDSELNSTSTNPVQNKVINENLQNLKELVGDTPVSEQISDAIFASNSFSGDYNDLTNAPNITEDNSDTVFFADNNGRIVAKIDKEGVHAAAVVLNGEDLTYKINTEFNIIKDQISQYDRLRIGLVPLGTEITDNTDLNSLMYLSVGSYYCSANKIVATLDNCPTVHAFLMHVYSPLSANIDNEETSQWVYRIRKILTYEGDEFIQVVYSSSEPGVFVYKPWQKITKIDDVFAAMTSKMDSQPISIELNTTGGLRNYGGFIDFHYVDADGNPSANTDYSSRIIEKDDGVLSVNGVLFDTNSIAANSKVMTTNDITYSTTDLTAGSSTLATGKLYIVYE